MVLDRITATQPRGAAVAAGRPGALCFRPVTPGALGVPA
jgi:hypothetical protein